MLWFPSVVRQAAYLTARPPDWGMKWWVGAQDAQGRLITAWSQRPETPHILAQLKFNGRVGALADKVDEKLGIGYIQEAKWVNARKVWIDTTNTASGAPPMPPEAPKASGPLEDEIIASVKLAGRVSSPSEIVRLELCKGIGAFGAEVRLDHYEHDHREVVDFPLWQTVYANASAAEEAINAIIQNRQKIGYAVEEKDMSRIFTATLQHGPIITPPTEGALIWDF